MRQPRARRSTGSGKWDFPFISLQYLVITLLLLTDVLSGERVISSPRRRRQDGEDVTTVLLVDSHGRSQFGRFLNVKPDVGVLTSTARTFIQEGVTTEYATQVVGTTLDNGRLYAHLLTKSSRVLYDNDAQTRSPNFDPNSSPKKWNLDPNLVGKGNFVKNTDFVSPNQVDSPFVVFPTSSPLTAEVFKESKELSDEELLQEPSNNPRVPFEESKKETRTFSVSTGSGNNNVKVFQINPQHRHIDLHQARPLVDSEENDVIRKDELGPSKVREWDNLPTFTVRNEFSPSGFSFLGDLPDFDVNTEKSKQTTAAERRAKLLFKGGIPNKQDLKTVTYTGFADFTTTVGDTVIVFTPQTSEPARPTSQIIIPIIPTSTLNEPPIATRVKTFLNHEPGVVTETVEGHKLTMEKSLPTMVVDSTTRTPKQQELPIEPKETPQLETVESTTSASTTTFVPEIEPSESQIPMLSTPSDEDIAKIFASLQAKAVQQATEPLNTPSTIFFEEETTSTTEKPLGGATTIFFDDDESTETTEIPIVEATAVLTTTPHVVPETTEASQEETASEESEESLEKQTTENIVTTTFKAETTTNEVPITTTTEQEQTTTELQPETTTLVKEEEEEESGECKDGLKVVPTTSYKTLTYLTTFFIPGDDGETSTSIKSNQVVSSEVAKETQQCISATPVVENVPATEVATTEFAETTTEQITEAHDSEITTTEASPITTTTLTPEVEAESEEEKEKEVTTTENVPTEITTERRHVTESDPETTEMTTENGEEIELLFKTLYTTYTYLTTYFQESTSSVASRKVVITNVITSTLDPSAQASEDPIAGLINQDFKSKPVSFEDFAEIAPSGVGIGRPTALPDGNVTPNPDDAEASLPESAKATPALSDKNILNTVNAIKTYYTTYTYFTTIFVDGETEISSRTEVYTNYVTPTTAPEEIEATATTADQDGVKSKIMALELGLGNYNSTINRQKSIDNNIENDIVSTSAISNDAKSLSNNIIANESSENDLLDLSEYETISTMVTDVRSSTSRGDKHILDNDKRNVLLDDQIVSESNNESEIIPSPTLLLQTSYTTFTYFTTMYQGTTSSNIVSRLETVTNVVTETLTPTHTLSVEDLSLPITYFTTFTYWTTLYKEGTTKVTSREETVSNVVNPTPGDNIVPTAVPEIKSTSVVAPIEVVTTQVPSLENVNPIIPLDSSEKIEASVEPTKVLDNDDDQTTYYTTYTYYTTSYVGNSTILNSRLETVTNVVNKTAELDNAIGRAIGQGILNSLDSGKETHKEIKPTGLLSTIRSTVDNDGTQTVLSTDVYGTYIDGLYAKVLESTSIIVTAPIEESTVSSESVSSETLEPSTTSSSKSEEKLKPTGVVSINQGQIVDADGISTLFYTTKAVGTYIDNLYAQVIESTSSFKVDEEKKAAQTEQPPAHRTGLVRLIEGSIVHSDTTTVYQSKVLGTVIDGRYAQIIESTSSFIIEPTISPTATQSVLVEPTASISPSPVVIEGSISDTTGLEDTTDNPEDEDENSTEDSDGRVKSRLTFQSRKRTFTPVIRPFASRAKPTFAPKRKGSKAGSATTITRSDFTPTVTAIPATKSGNRFGGGRKSSTFSAILPTASGSRRFSRPRSSSSAVAGGLSSTFVPNRGRSSGRIQPTASVFGSSTRRPNGFRSSGLSSAGIRPSSSFNANNRFARIRPTSTFNANRNANSVTLPSTISDEENDLTTQVTDDPTNVDENETTTTALETTSARRNGNPLLRFRRPPLSRPTSAPRTATTRAVGSTANRSTNTRNGRLTTTPLPKSTRTPLRNNAISSRARPANSLFPRRNLFTTTTTPEPEEEEEEEEEQEDELDNTGNEDTEFEGTDTNTQTEKVPSPLERRSRANSVLIKPFIRKRAKRQTNFSRFRRPTSRTTPAPVEEEPETETPRTRSRYTGYQSRSRTTPAPRIIPSKPSPRSQFTLRDSNSRTSNFRRPSTVSSNLRKPTSRPSSRQSSHLRNSNTERSANTNSNKSRKNSSSRRRGSTSSRGKLAELDTNYVLPGSDGTITVTHQIPTEVTIPVVNGKITEYKNIVTAKLSTEVLSPKQYSTTTNPFGKDITVLLSESTGFGVNGAQQITKYTLNESPTTTVIFTPTYIRGRKTSFSHVIPSTVYVVDPIVNTLTPALPQAPLANILLSQLLLGQQQGNPLLGLQQQGAVAGTPTTEFKTRTTTYVTTVTSETSTVIPLTFRGKEILTTIIDSSTNVITATEFITDTVVVTPTAVSPQNQQLNSLLVPLLLQQQQQQQQINPLFQQPQLLQNPAGVINVNSNEELFKKALFQDTEQTKQNLALDEEGDINDDYQNVDDVTEAPRKPTRANKLPKPKKPAAPETSVITLYVSGRTPGEFSTVLSTVVVGEENKKKREAPYFPVQPSKIHDDLVISTLEYVDTYVMPAMGDVLLDHSEPAYNTPTESLESIVGDVSKKIVTDTPDLMVKPTKPGSMASKKYKIKYEKVGADKSHAARGLEEARYNLATRIMSNGVEVIVAGDKTTLPGEPDVKRVLPSSIYKAVTLKPSTLTNNMMMVLPQEASKIESLSSSLYPNQFVTKTCLTTFTYLTTYLENGTTTVSSHEQVVSNVATEERNTGNTGKILPTPAMGITLTQYPNLAVGTFVTTYTYLNTILDGEQPLVVTSKRVVSNTVTAPDDYLSLFQPNDKASAVKDTNTYYSTIALEKTLYEGKISKVIRTNEVVTQVVITESIPPKGTSVMTSYIALDFDESDDKTNDYTTTDVVKTYFVTYTYYNTLVDGTATVVNTNVSTSKDVVTEKLFLHPKKKSKPSVINTAPINKENTKKKNKLESDLANLNIIATKTYLTTFTYFTTMLQEDGDDTSTVISSHSKVVENIVTEVIEPSLLDKKYLHSLKKEIKESGGNTVTKNATLSDGQKIEITVGTKDKDKIKPSKVLPTIEKTKMPDLTPSAPAIESSNPNVVTGSTIIFVDEFDDPFAQPTTKQSTPSLNKVTKTQSKNALSSLLSSEIVKKTSTTSTSKRKTSTKRKATISATKPTQSHISSSTSKISQDKPKDTNVEKEQDKKPAKVAKPVPTASPVSNLLGSIQALRPVFNAMAGLIKSNIQSKANDSANQKQPIQAEPESLNEVQNRSPIYIPVGGLADIETAESQHLPALNHWEEEKKVSKPTHESPLLNGGIPISPGEVITANSDVIVGKPGRVGPRIPAIPLNHPDLATAVPQEIEGMKPPPVPAKTWPKRQSEQQTATAHHPIIHVPNKNDYVGPPPPAVQKLPVRGQNAVRLNKHDTGREQITIPINEQFYLNTNQPKHRVEIHVQDDGNRYTEDGLIVASPIGGISNFALQSSYNEQVVLPEVIERSTGQPLLVNIQPSQVAFVNIPHNRTTALIYGGSTEPHINGQYFDDPSPYPEPEFSAIESFSNGVPKFASVYNGQPNQKEVGGVIKVGNHAINIKPHSIPLDFGQVDIRPSKPNLDYINGVHVDSHVNHHDINVNVPPISFGMVQQGNEFNAHIIKHEGIVSSVDRRPARPHEPGKHENNFVVPRPRPPIETNTGEYNVKPDIQRTPHRPFGEHHRQQQYYHKPQLEHQRPVEHTRPYPPPTHRPQEHRAEHNPRPNDQHRPHRPTEPHRFPHKPQEQIIHQVRPSLEQPQVFNQHLNVVPNDMPRPQRPKYTQRPGPIHRPVLIPEQNRPVGGFNNYMRPPHSNTHETFIKDSSYGHSTPVVNNHPQINQIESESSEDYISDAGEVIQESNSRPLIPGQLPFEVLKDNISSASGSNVEVPIKNRYNHIPHENEILAYKPHIKQPRPFDNPVVRPENQQSNQINHQESNVIVQSGSPNIYANVFGNDHALQRPIQHHQKPRPSISKHDQVRPVTTHNGPVYLSTTTERNDYLHKLNQRYTVAPRITSLPIDHTQRINTNTFHPQHVSASQTEEPYQNPSLDSKPGGVFVFDSHDIPNRRRTTASTTTTTTTSTTTTTTTTTTKKPTTKSQDGLQLNIGEIHKINSDFDLVPPKQQFGSGIHSIPNVTRPIKPHDMEIMKPPPEEPIVGLEAPPKVPDIKLNPPKIEVVRVPPTLIPTTKKTTRPPLNEIVMGMNPPPPVQLPSLQSPQQLVPAVPTVPAFDYNNATYKPNFSMEIDVPTVSTSRSTSKPSTYIFELPPTTQAPRVRRPVTRRPSLRRTTTISNQVDLGVTRPYQNNKTYQNNRHYLRNITQNEVDQNNIRDTTTVRNHISTTGTNYVYGSNRVNYFDINRPRRPIPSKSTTTTLTTPTAPTTTATSPEDEVPFDTSVARNTSIYIDNRRKTESPDLIPRTTPSPPPVAPDVTTDSQLNDLDSQETGVPIDSDMPDHTPPLPTGTVETVDLEFTRYTSTPVQTFHTGNEVKISDSTTSGPRRRIVTSIFKRPIHRNKTTIITVPTRYVTHTMTSTVTITKTTVVNSQNGLPSTMTILVTKTEKLTIVDTVTEVHTLVKPTTIAETVTVSPTAVLHTTPILEENEYHEDYPIIPTIVHSSEIEPTIVIDGSNPETIDDGLEDFIINDHDTMEDLHVAQTNKNHHEENENDGDTFFVVMNDKNQGSIIKIPKQHSTNVHAKEENNRETQQRDEMINTNEVNRVLQGGILIQPPPSLEILPDKCSPECKPSRNELCQRVDGLMRCLCRPGFARMFPDRPCKPTYTYTLKIGLERHGNNVLSYNESLINETSPAFTKLARVTHDGLDRLLMQSDLRDIYHGVAVQTFEPIEEDTQGVYNTFNLQLSDNTDESRLKEVFKKYLRNNNYSLGGTELYASRGVLERLNADDFNECSDAQYHDCSEFAQCFNLRGTYTCSCKEGYADLSENILYPGRICSAEMVGCAQCHYHGTCYTRSDDKILCECFQWYAGDNCQINLKVLLIGLVTLGAILFTLLLICIIVTCARKKPQHSIPGSGMAFLPQPRRGTIDRRAMIQDTSSESGSDTLPYVVKKANKKMQKVNAGRPKEEREPTVVYSDQKDRSLTVMIPRAKYHPAPNTQYGGSNTNLTTFDKRKTSAASSNEAKLLSYLDAGPSPNKIDQRKVSKSSDLCYREGPSSRKTSGALVSAGFEVSATVGVVNNMGTLATIATTCGTEADRSENATLIQKISADRRSSTGTHSQFNTLGKSVADTADTDEDVVENWLDITPRIQTISESRSYDETTIQMPMKSFKHDYDTKSSQHNHDEANTMAERDLGSTFLLPHTHLYKPDRGSDISGFESL